MSKQFDYSNYPRMISNVEEHLNLQGKLGVTVRSRFNSSINGSDEMSGFKSLRLSRFVGSWMDHQYFAMLRPL